MSLARFAAAAALGFAICTATAEAQLNPYETLDRVGGTLTRLGILLPTRVINGAAVSKALDELTREKCDQTAIADLAKALQAAGYRREASTALVRFSDTCGGHTTSLRTAVNVLMGLSDYSAAKTVASMLVKLEPFSDNGYFLRAVASEKLGDSNSALNDYTTAIELFGDKSRIGSISYYNIARIYEQLGRYCDAILPIQNWVALAPSHDTSQTRAIIATYTSQGKCAASSGKAEKFPANGGNVVKVTAVVNGVQGVFVIDTGATFVAVSQAFARKANIQAEPGGTMQMHTANGVVEAHRARAKSIQLRSLRAADVVVAIHTDKPGTFGAGVDGLLGMSFLARFKLTIDSVNMTIAP
jgi:aspartyl protease family protein